MSKSLDKALRALSGRNLRDIKKATWGYDGLVLARGAVDWYQHWPHTGVLLHERNIVGWIIETVWSETASASAVGAPVGAVLRIEQGFVVPEKRQPRAFQALDGGAEPSGPRAMTEILRIVDRRPGHRNGRNFKPREVLWNDATLRTLIWWFGRVRLVQTEGRGQRVWEFARPNRRAPYALLDPDLSEHFVENNNVRTFSEQEAAAYATQRLR